MSAAASIEACISRASTRNGRIRDYYEDLSCDDCAIAVTAVGAIERMGGDRIMATRELRRIAERLNIIATAVADDAKNSDE